MDDIAIIDHGNAVNGQQLGDNYFPVTVVEQIARMLDDGAQVYLFGCWVGTNVPYVDWWAGDVGPEARIHAVDGLLDYWLTQPPAPRSPAQWLIFDGVDHGYHP